MEIKVQIPSEELVAIVKQLSPGEKAELRSQLDQETFPTQKSRLTELLLNGSVFTEEQIDVIKEPKINQPMAGKTLMIDTRLLIDYFRKTDKSKTRLFPLSRLFEHLSISSVTQFEVYSGATPFQLLFWEELLSEIAVLLFDRKAADIAVDIHKDLKKRRESIDKADLFIAATAVANDPQLDTLNRKHFEKIGQLTLFENQVS